MYTDTIADMLVRIKNACMKSKEVVEIPSSRMKEDIAKILKDEGYIANYKKIEDKKQGILKIFLKYTADGQPVIKGIRRVSKPSRRVYTRAKLIRRVLRGIGIAIISTPYGIKTDSKAREEHAGGEVICYIW
ncbi:MAG: 30S ribosomal protein S8 [Elusimicrobia bacterium ADurb.Bin231]|nr:MAG: 30S ribosomal protein S8 [Elusimicrobia bacterium ADurb.Bin231]